MCVRINPNDMAATLGSIETRVRAMAPDARFRFRFFDEDIGRLYRVEAMTGAVVVYIAVVAVVISCLGLFGLAAYTSQRRTKEIGVRKVMGASTLQVIRLLSSESVATVLISCLIAGPIAYVAMNRWLENFAYRIELGAGTFIAATLLAMLITLVTVSSQAIRAASTNPSDSLRHE
jgi:putative ABC transport system permease protein